MDSLNVFYELDRIALIREMFEGLDAGEQVTLTNVKGGLQGFIPFIIASRTGRSVLFVAASDREAREQYHVFSKSTSLNCLYYPKETALSYVSDAHSQDTTILRTRVLDEIRSGRVVLVFASMDALLKKLRPIEEAKSQKIEVKIGEETGLDALAEALFDFGYERVYQTEAHGQFSVRGDIIDVYPMASTTAYRIEFFDDEIDSIRRLDVEDQRSSDRLETITIGPAGEVLLTEEERNEAIAALKAALSGSNPREREMLLEKIEVDPAGYDEFLSGFLGDASSLIDYMRQAEPEMTVVWDDPSASRVNANLFLEQSAKDLQNFALSQGVLPLDLGKFFTTAQIERKLRQGRIVLEYLFGTRIKTGLILDMDSRAIESFAGQPTILEEFLKNRVRDDYFIHIFCKDEKGTDRVKNWLIDHDITRIAGPEDAEDLPGIRISVGEISEGFELARQKIVYINESEFFKPEKKRRRRKNPNAKKIERFTDLKVGDFVVHDTHGIGIYKGIEKMEIDGVAKDLMKISYKGDSNLFIPVEQMDSIQAYIGTGEAAPKVSSLGSPEWKKAKAKATKAAEEIADELVELYAKRRQTKGYAFEPDTPWQRQFEDAFPFEETDDQLRSIEEIKHDMESSQPMDRLLCGDVGYGKTEVALRAAFKAAMDGKQTAILVPTTVLAQQHYNTALSRFENFPVNIAELSRFKSPAEQKQVIKDLKSGRVDIVIGTHRLLSKDVEFKDLGLLIIDEEQRFGVKSKEKLKSLKENIDVLTLSATPIPRTLHMSLSGVRDMSVLDEPPAERLPVETYVLEYSPYIAAEAIEREIERGGQVYFIHNQIQDIERIRDELIKFIPDLRIAVAHGRMSGKELEAIMEAFQNREYDVLLATTIVESGLDFRNANTLIVHNADHFGLAQLYQLRGRVGRSSTQAYAYITTPRNKILATDAQKRLKAIRDFTAFGSGFKIAMRDLEIRGAGSLLGSAQSGHLAKIGYELYTRILDQAVKKRTGATPVKERTPVTIKIAVDAYIPEYYVSDEKTKYDLYIRLSALDGRADYDAFEDELIDRFGEIPQSVYNLMGIALLKNAANRIGITEIELSGGVVTIRFAKDATIHAPIDTILSYFPKKWNVSLNAGTAEEPAFRFTPDVRGYKLLEKLYGFLTMLETPPEKREQAT